jgi:hypothetical protein
MNWRTPGICLNKFTNIDSHRLKAWTLGETIVSELFKSISSSPELRSLFERYNDGSIRVTGDINDKRWIHLAMNFFKPKDQEIWGVFELVNNADIAASGSQELKRQMNPCVAELLADRGLMGYILSELENFQPWMMGATEDIFKHYTNEVNKALTFMTLPNISLDQGRKSVEKGISKLGNPTDGRFNFPKEEQRTQSNVETLRAAERSLDAVWAEVRKRLESQDKKDWDGIIQGCLDPSLPWTIDSMLTPYSSVCSSLIEL